MATQIQILRGTTAQNDAFTGEAGALTVDTTLKNLRLHDGVTAGGVTIGGQTFSNELRIRNPDFAYNETVQAAKYCMCKFTDRNNTEFARIAGERTPAGSNLVEIVTRDPSGGWHIPFRGVATSSGDSYAEIELYDANSSKTNTRIASEGWVNDPALSTNVVHRDGDETMAGTKRIPLYSATSSKTETKIASEGWVNDSSKSTNIVHRDNDESIDGEKTFLSAVRIKKSSPHIIMGNQGVTLGQSTTGIGLYSSFSIHTKDYADELGYFRHRYFTESNTNFSQLEMIAMDPTANRAASNKKNVAIYIKTDGTNRLAELNYDPPSTSWSGEIATTKFAKEMLARNNVSIDAKVDVNRILTCTALDKTTHPGCGFTKLGNGLLIQWGQFTPSSSPDYADIQVITLHTAFYSQDSYQVVMTGNFTNTSGTWVTPSIYNKTSTTFTCATSADGGRYWIAIGWAF